MQNSSPPLFLKQRSSRTFILSVVALALFTDLTLYGIAVPTLPFVLINRLKCSLHEVQYYISVLLTSYALSSFIFSVPAGYIIDRLSTRRVPFFMGLLALIASTILLALGQSIEVLVLARVLQGMSAAVVWIVGFVIVQDTVPRNKLGTSIGTIFSFISIGNFMAPVIGGIVYDKLGDKAILVVELGLLGIDLVMRIIMVERGVAEAWGMIYEDDKGLGDEQTADIEGSSCPVASNDETSPLLIPSQTTLYELKYVIPANLPVYLPTPLLYILFNSPSLLVASLAAILQPTLVSIHDTLIPIHALHLFGFTSLQSGLLFIPLLTPMIVLGPVAGFLVDRYGTKLMATFGFLYLSIPLILLQIPQAGGIIEIAKFAFILLFCGIGSSMVCAVSLVEWSNVVAKYHAANPKTFGERGPVASMFAFNNVLSNAGLALGPLIAVWLEKLGYAGTMLFMAGACFVVGILCYTYVGDDSLKNKDKSRKNIARD